MAKIIKIEGDVVFIGNNNGDLIEIKIEDCNFDPKIGDEVNIFSSCKRIICTKNEFDKNNKANTQDSIKDSSININLVQSQNNDDSFDNYWTTNSKRAVNKVLYILLAVFFGGIGIHKFYSGKTAKGVIYFLFSWTGIPTIIGIIEGICACFKKEDFRGRILV